MKSNFNKLIFFIVINIQKVIFSFIYCFSPQNEKKIVIGVHEIANILFNLKLIFKNNCTVVCKNNKLFYPNNNYDIDLRQNSKMINIFISAYYFGLLAKNALFFIYLWEKGFLIDREIEFQFLKKHKIPIICIFLGDDIRSRKLFLEYCKSINFNTYVDYDNSYYFLSDDYDLKKKILAEQADKYATIIFSHKVDQLSYIKKTQYFFPPLINFNIFSNNPDKIVSSQIRIVHAPSSPVIKGTPLVRSVIKKLENEGYIFSYKELINKSHQEVIDELNKSHIVLNQFYTLIPGIFGLEAMATFNAVLMSAKPEEFPYQFNNAWMITDDWQLYNNLKYLLDNPKMITVYASNGFLYMKNNFTEFAASEYIRDIFNQHEIYF